jgi:hypothetical protein
MRFPQIAEAGYALDARYAEWFELAVAFVRAANSSLAAKLRSIERG